MIAVDFDAGSIWFGIKGVWDGDPSTGAAPTYSFTPNTQLFVCASTSSSPGIRLHAGADAMTYTVPTGFDVGFLA
jgi:hypothetical protein